jgi:hypothetical protein
MGALLDNHIIAPYGCSGRKSFADAIAKEKNPLMDNSPPEHFPDLTSLSELDRVPN